MEDLIGKLQSLGISGREAEVYLALLQKNEMTAPEVAKLTTVSRTKIYEILQNLVKKGLCNERHRNGLKVFRCIEPSIALQNILHSDEQELARKKKLADNFQSELMELFLKKAKTNDPLDFIEVISDIGQLRERWVRIQDNTKKELIGFTKPPYVISFEDTLAIQEVPAAKKIILKGIYEYSHVKSKEEKDLLIKGVESYEKLGEEVRLINELPMKLVISDEMVTMFVLENRVSLKMGLTAMIVTHPDFAKMMKFVFDTYWNLSITLKQFRNIHLK
jgi:sugar-specific transcriptional regulator TrmB